MDESRKPGDSARVKYPWQNDEAPGEKLGATGVFGTVPEPSVDTGPGLVTKDDGSLGDGRVLPQNAPQVPAHGGREGLQEPIVHKVVIGGGSATTLIDLLEVLRTNSAAEEPTLGPAMVEPQRPRTTAAAPAPSAGSPPGQSSEGFTQLLRALGKDSSPVSAAGQPVPEERSAAIPDSPGAGKESDFTSLMRTLNPDGGSDRPEKRQELRATPLSTEPSDGVGGFTALLQGFSGTDSDSGGQQPNPRPLYENAGAASPAIPITPPASVSGQATPGAFTQLFSALAPEATNPVAAEPAAMNSRSTNTPAIYPEHNPMSRPSGEEASFTQLISTIGQPSPGASPYRDDRKSVPDDFSPRPSPVREDMFASNQPPTGITDWSRPTAPRPQPQPEYSSESGGLTQLLRTLDGPAKGPDIPVAYPSAGETPAPSPAGGSLFTQTYRKLDQPAPPASPAPAPSYSPPSKLSATQPFASPFTGNFFPDQGPAAPVAPNLSAGPSDVTRILDASKLREMQRPGGSVPAPAFGSPAAPQPLPAPPAMPQPLAPPQLQWQPQVPQAPAPWQPPQYAPPAPTPQMPVPAASPAPAAPAAMGKMQQYLPLLLIIIIFLLVVILVTVVFMLKH